MVQGMMFKVFHRKGGWPQEKNSCQTPSGAGPAAGQQSRGAGGKITQASAMSLRNKSKRGKLSEKVPKPGPWGPSVIKTGGFTNSKNKKTEGGNNANGKKEGPEKNFGNSRSKDRPPQSGGGRIVTLRGGGSRQFLHG